jgi:hypothetical protein
MEGFNYYDQNPDYEEQTAGNEREQASPARLEIFLVMKGQLIACGAPALSLMIGHDLLHWTYFNGHGKSEVADVEK